MKKRIETEKILRHLDMDEVSRLLMATSGLAAKTDMQNHDESLYLPWAVHAVDTMLVMAYLLETWVPEPVLKIMTAGRVPAAELFAVLIQLAGLHDIGKLTAAMQGFLLGKLDKEENPHCQGTEGKISHSLAGAVILRFLGCPDEVGAVVGSHHGSCLLIEARNSMADGTLDNLLNSHISNKKFSYVGLDFDWWAAKWAEAVHIIKKMTDGSDFPLDFRGQIMASGLVSMADWIASNTDLFPLIPTTSSGVEIDFDKRLETALSRLELTGLQSSSGEEMDTEGFAEYFGFEANDFQKAVLEILAEGQDVGLMILESTMGSGKTEAAFAASQVLQVRNHIPGLFFGLPTQATANGLYLRFENWGKHLSDNHPMSLSLMHSKAGLNEDFMQLKAESRNNNSEGGLVVSGWMQGRHRKMLSDLALGTIDQALFAGLKRKYFAFPHLGLAGKVVVLDEIHSYNPWMETFIKALLGWLGAYGVPVILLSATLPNQKRLELTQAYLKGKYHADQTSIPNPKIRLLRPAFEETRLSYPRITWTEKGTVKSRAVSVAGNRTVHMKRLSWNLEAEKFLDLLDYYQGEGACIGIILNTVKRSQELYELLKEKYPNIILLHSGFTDADRAVLEKEVEKTTGKKSTGSIREGAVVIGSPILQCSLDIDVDVLFTDLCPMDALLQRIGRLQRHGMKDGIRPECTRTALCHVFGLEDYEERLDRNSEFIYGEWLLKQTGKAITAEMLIPKDIPYLMERVYTAADDSSAYRKYESWIKGKAEGPEKNVLAYPEITADKRNINQILDFHEDSRQEEWLGSVRDIEFRFSVLVVFRHGESGRYFWNGSGMLAGSEPLDFQKVQSLLRQQISLPAWISKNHWKSCLNLFEETAAELKDWKNSNFLKRENFLILDAEGNGRIDEIPVRYTAEKGFEYGKREEV